MMKFQLINLELLAKFLIICSKKYNCSSFKTT